MALKPGARVDVMFAFLAIDENDIEGVAAFTPPGKPSIPLVGADMERVNSLRPIAEALARSTGAKIELVCFEARKTLEVFG